jgi:alpha-N-arabinofuranosidase
VALITLATEWGDPQDAADLVEYLNHPNDGSNPNGGRDWAALRAADGHPKPYGVIWFEFGNEEYGSSRKTKENPNPVYIGPEEYASRFLKYREAMRAVDPGTRLGGVVQYGEWTWTRRVLEGCGKQMDFAIEHTYVPNYKRNDAATAPSLIAKACAASDADIQKRYDRLNAQISEFTGRSDLMLAITEYNGHFVQEKPLPYRQTLANALRNAEHLRIMMKPENRILMANFWQFANEYWGMVQGYTHLGERPVKQANFFPYQLYHEHFGDTLIKSDVDCRTWDFPGAAGVQERTGQSRQFTVWETNLLPKDYTWEGKFRLDSVTLRREGKIASAEFSGDDINFAHFRVRLAVESSTGYRVTGYIKTENLVEKDGVNFEIQDGRGWDATHSAAASEKVKGSADWTRVQADYVTLPDAKEISIITRRIQGNGPITGKAWFRLESVQKFLPATGGAVPDLGVNSAKRHDGTVTVMVVNKNTEEPVPVHVGIAGAEERKGHSRAWLLSGPSCLATNLTDPDAVGISEVSVGIEKDNYFITMPPCSMAALEITPLND